MGEKKNLGSREMTCRQTWCFHKLAAAAKAAFERDGVHALWFARGRRHALLKKMAYWKCSLCGWRSPESWGKCKFLIINWRFHGTHQEANSPRIKSPYGRKRRRQRKKDLFSQPAIQPSNLGPPVSVHGRKSRMQLELHSFSIARAFLDAEGSCRWSQCTPSTGNVYGRC